ncbi:hypothetical protein ACEQ8H_002212 [Pleosporales sp. CAS-2024a]
MASHSKQPDQDLRYPPVHINRSLQQLDLESLIMRSTTRRPQEQAGSTLEESTFELLALSDSLVETSDDEAHTESIASTDGCTPDDASSFSDDDDDVDYGTDSRYLQHSTASLLPEAHEQQQHDAPSIHSVGDSTLTEVPAPLGNSGHSHSIRLDEQPGPDDGLSSGSKVIRSFPDENGTCYSVFDGYKCSEIRVVVRAALSAKSIPTPDSYRILYIGMPDKWDEDVITTKITAALTASPGTSRSIMVQGQLEPYGPIMHVDRCTDIVILSAENEPAIVALNLDSGERLTFGQARRFSSVVRPDLVIFCYPSAPRSTTDARDYAYTREACEREQMPYLELTSVRQYHHGALSYNSRNLAVCMEGRNDSSTDFELKEVLPIDHFTFNDLEPAQINRHLALISPHMMAVANKNFGAAQTGGRWKTAGEKARFQFPGLPKIFLTLLSAMITAYFCGPILVPIIRDMSFNTDASPAVFTPYSELCSSQSSSSPSTSMAVSAAAPSVTSTTSGLTVVPPQADPPKRSKKKAEKLVRFEIKPTDDHQFTLIPNLEILNARKKAQLQIQVKRHGEHVPINFNRTISGVYVVDLEHEYPFGVFSVDIVSYSKPLVQQSFEITLGRNKTIFDHFIDSTLFNIGLSQSNIFNASNKAARSLQASVADLKVTIGHLGDLKLQVHLDGARKAIKKDVATIRQMPKVAWAGIKDMTAPVRRSSSMSKLRSRALWIRCETEKAAGLSSKKQDGKSSWACSKVGGSS